MTMESAFATLKLPPERTGFAPDGSDVRVLLALAGGSMAHFSLAAGATARALTHRTVEEIWFVLGGSGQMWRKQSGQEELVALGPGVCLSIPLATHFQFRASPTEALWVVAVTMPPWPAEGEAQMVVGPWQASV